MRSRKLQGQPVAALSPLVMHATCKAAHQVDAIIADVCVLERLGHRQRRELRRIEFAAGILNARDQRCAIALQFDCYLHAIVFCATVHNDVRDGFLKAKLNRERGVGR
jgi:hypothetical protein